MDFFIDSLKDSLSLIPFLFITYAAMEFLEHHAGSKSADAIHKAGPAGPFIGGIIGILPQCGFSAAAASLYAGRVIGIGTLTAVFFSTSDEMLPIFISSSVPAGTIIKILSLKVIIAVISGYAASLIFRLMHFEQENEPDIHTVCEEEHCHCEHGILHSAAVHTLKIFIYIFIITLALNYVIGTVGTDTLSSLFYNMPMIPELVTSLIGLIPNCASSVVITQMYLEGIIGAGALMSGLLVNAGVGLLVLIRLNRRARENSFIIIMLYLMSVFWGIIIDAMNIVF